LQFINLGLNAGHPSPESPDNYQDQNWRLQKEQDKNDFQRAIPRNSMIILLPRPIASIPPPALSLNDETPLRDLSGD
jgi:hypothetical protein